MTAEAKSRTQRAFRDQYPLCGSESEGPYLARTKRAARNPRRYTTLAGASTRVGDCKLIA